jgi:spermidine synthase
MVFGLPVLLQPVLSPSWGSGPSLFAILVALNLLGGALGAWLGRVPAWSAALCLSALLLSPAISIALGSASSVPGAALVFFASLCTGRWVVSLLGPSSRGASRWLALEGIGGALAVLWLLLAGFSRWELPELGRILGLVALLGGALSLGGRNGSNRASTIPGATTPARAMLVLSAWSGFQFFHGETAWAHLLAQIHTNSPLAFGLVMLGVLGGMPLGAMLARRVRDLRQMAFLAMGGGLALALLHQALGQTLGDNVARQGFPWDLLLASLAMLAPVVMVSSMLLPWLLDRADGPRSIARLFAANLTGGLAGAVLAGWVSLPVLGLQAALLLPSLGWMVIAVVASQGRKRGLALAGSLALVGSGWAAWSMALVPRGDYEVLDRAEGWGGRVELVEREEHRFLVYNGSYALGGSRSVAAQKRQARLALDLRPQARTAFVLGLGTGITAGELSTSKALVSVRVLELEPQVVTMARRHFGPWTEALFSDPRFRIEAGDARAVLRDDPQRYDLILGDLFLPWLPGAELLMSTEHFRSVRNHLNPQGLFVQWLPLYQLSAPVFQDILATVRFVFGDVHLFRGTDDHARPMIALVALAPGARLHAQGVGPEVLGCYAGNVRKLSLLDPLMPWNHANRLVLGARSGGVFAGMPSAEEAMTGERYLNWIVASFRANPPERDSALMAFGPEAWRHAAGGFFRQQERFFREQGEAVVADTMAQRMVRYGPASGL